MKEIDRLIESALKRGVFTAFRLGFTGMEALFLSVHTEMPRTPFTGFIP